MTKGRGRVAVTPMIVCDRCGKEAQSFHIEFPDGRRWNVDLCPVHERPVTDFATKGVGREVRKGVRKTFKKTDPSQLVKKKP